MDVHNIMAYLKLRFLSNKMHYGKSQKILKSLSSLVKMVF